MLGFIEGLVVGAVVVVVVPKAYAFVAKQVAAVKAKAAAAEATVKKDL